MAVGEANTGKTTLLKALFEPDAEPTPGEMLPPPPKTVLVVPRQVSIEEHGVSFKLNIIDTPGFGDGERALFFLSIGSSHISSMLCKCRTNPLLSKTIVVGSRPISCSNQLLPSLPVHAMTLLSSSFLPLPTSLLHLLSSTLAPLHLSGVNNAGCWEQIVEYIETTFVDYLRDESSANRNELVDRRVYVTSDGLLSSLLRPSILPLITHESCSLLYHTMILAFTHRFFAPVSIISIITSSHLCCLRTLSRTHVATRTPIHVKHAFQHMQKTGIYYVRGCARVRVYTYSNVKAPPSIQPPLV